MRLLFLDFETYWDSKTYTLTKMNTLSYIMDPQFKAHGASVARLDGEPIWVTGHKLPQFFASIDWSTVALATFNSAFDGSILAYRYNVHPRLHVDVMGMARAMLGNAVPRFNLDTVATHLGLGSKLSTKFMSTDTVRDLYPTQEAELAEYCCRDVDLTRAIYRMLAKDFPAQQYRSLDWTIRMMTQPRLKLDEALLRKAHLDEVQRKEAILASLGVSAVDIRSNNRFAALLEQALAPYDQSPPVKTSQRTQSVTYAFSKQDEEFVDLLEHPDDTVRALVSARLNTKGSLLETRALAMADAATVLDGWAPVGLNFSGAVTTHRLSGNQNGAIPNPQNLSRGSMLRRGIVAPPNHRIVAMDLSQIELRIGAMFAGQTDIIDQLRSGGDTYASFASHVYGRPIVKGVDKEERDVGKVTVLSCQYKSGAGALRRMLMVQAKLRKDLDFCKHVVNAYRTVFACYPALWDRLKTTIWLWANGESGLESGAFENLPCVSVERGRITLPSGLALKYPDVQYGPFKGSVQFTFASSNRLKSENGRQLLHEGILMENICQAMAREVMDHIMQVIADEEGLWPSMQVHDEIVHVVPERDADRFLKTALTIANRPISWWPGLPVTAEGGHALNYLDCPKEKLK